VFQDPIQVVSCALLVMPSCGIDEPDNAPLSHASEQDRAVAGDTLLGLPKGFVLACIVVDAADRPGRLKLSTMS
jgi:hypothetical protein